MSISSVFRKPSAWLLAAALVLGPVAQTWADGVYDGYGYHHGWGGGWSMMFMGPFSMILFTVLIVVLLFLAVRWLMPHTDGGRERRQNALDILDERFARGEIDVEEYRSRKDALRQKS